MISGSAVRHPDSDNGFLGVYVGAACNAGSKCLLSNQAVLYVSLCHGCHDHGTGDAVRPCIKFICSLVRNLQTGQPKKICLCAVRWRVERVRECRRKIQHTSENSQRLIDNHWPLILFLDFNSRLYEPLTTLRRRKREREREGKRYPYINCRK